MEQLRRVPAGGRGLGVPDAGDAATARGASEGQAHVGMVPWSSKQDNLGRVSACSTAPRPALGTMRRRAQAPCVALSSGGMQSPPPGGTAAGVAVGSCAAIPQTPSRHPDRHLQGARQRCCPGWCEGAGWAEALRHQRGQRLPAPSLGCPSAPRPVAPACMPSAAAAAPSVGQGEGALAGRPALRRHTHAEHGRRHAGPRKACTSRVRCGRWGVVSVLALCCC
jgi:hypothetical protein